MAPTRPEGKDATKDPNTLLTNAETQLQVGNLDNAISLATRALELTGSGGDHELRALNLLGVLHVEDGDVDEARAYLLRAIKADPDGTKEESIGGGPDKFLMLAQLSEDGGQDSVQWFERGASALREQIRTPSREDIAEKQQKLGGVLCAVAEVYMTDLSWEDDAEQRCETLITEAMLIAPDLPETWQTVANVRISQERAEEAQTALKRCLELWIDLPPEHTSVPDFPTRVALARLLLEVGMQEEAIRVLQRLVQDDDASVEAWYLGGWAFYIAGEKAKEEDNKDEGLSAWTSARWWLAHCLRYYSLQEYEDDRLGEHAVELFESINKELGPPPDGLGDFELEGDSDGEGGSDEEMR